MRLVVISPPDGTMEVAFLRNFFSKGLETFHLRKPGLARAAYTAYINKIDPAFQSRIMIHSHHDLIRSHKLRGIHYPEEARPASKPAKEHYMRSTSFHSLADVSAAADTYQTSFDYAFLSPIFDSVSKSGYKSAQYNETELQKVISSSPFALFALGGVDKEKLKQLADFGFAGVAVLGAVWNAENKLKSLEQLLEDCQMTDN